MKRKCIGILVLLSLLTGCGIQSEAKESENELPWVGEGIPQGYEKIWESEKDGILLEIYSQKDGNDSLFCMTNKNEMDVKINVDFTGETIDGKSYNLFFVCPEKLCSGDTYVTTTQMQYNPETIECKEEKPYYSLSDEEDKTLKNGVTFEVVGWDDEYQEIEYVIKNNTEKEVQKVNLNCLLVEDGVVIDKISISPISPPDRLKAGEEKECFFIPFDNFDKEKNQIFFYCTYQQVYWE